MCTHSERVPTLFQGKGTARRRKQTRPSAATLAHMHVWLRDRTCCLSGPDLPPRMSVTYNMRIPFREPQLRISLEIGVSKRGVIRIGTGPAAVGDGYVLHCDWPRRRHSAADCNWNSGARLASLLSGAVFCSRFRCACFRGSANPKCRADREVVHGQVDNMVWPRRHWGACSWRSGNHTRVRPVGPAAALEHGPAIWRRDIRRAGHARKEHGHARGCRG